MPAELLASLVGAPPPPLGLPAAGGVAFNSNRVRPGDAFFALPGASQHGIAHASAALERGAAFVVSDRPHRRGLTVSDPERALLELGMHARSQLSGPVVAISGSVGKTSTKAFAAAALAAHSSQGNFNTPRALACTLVDGWLQDPHRPLVLELGIDRPGEMDELVDLVRPSHGLLTSIAESHLHQLGSLSGVAREKSRLLERSPERLASVSAASRLPRQLPGLLSYGLTPSADVTGTISATRGEGLTIEALGVSIALPHLGRAMAENALAALALAWRLGLDLHTAARRIEAAQMEPGRLERKRSGEYLVLDDSYNSNPASAREALEVLAGFPPPRCAVLGDMLELGDQAERLHRELGAATLGLDAVVTVGELARHIAAANPRARHVDSAEDALPLLQELPPGTTVLIKASRGMRLERLVAALAPAEDGS